MNVAIVGVGRVGSALGFALVTRGLVDRLVLIDRDKKAIEGDACDLLHAAAFTNSAEVLASDNPADAAGCDLIAITASVPGKGFSSRLDMAQANARLFDEIIPPIAKASPGAILLVVTNPVDVMTYHALRRSGFPPSRVLGTGTLIDTGRFRSLLAQVAQIHPNDLRAYILGEHGDSQFPALSLANAGGAPFECQGAVAALAEQAKRGGDLVLQHKGHTNYAVALAAVMIIEAIAVNSRTVLPVSTLISGFLGVEDVCLSVPCVIGRSGVLRTLPIELDEQETAAFCASASVLKAVIRSIS